MNEQLHTQKTVDLILRIVLLAGLLYWCFVLVSPFLMPVLWGIIIAVALQPMHEWLTQKLKGKRKISALIITLILVTGIVIPAYEFFAAAGDLILLFKQAIEAGQVNTPAIPEELKAIPLVGENLTNFFGDFNNNVKEFLLKYKNEILHFLQKVVGVVLSTGINLFLVIVSMVIAGILLGYEGLGDWGYRLFNRVIGKDGEDYAKLSANTIRSVVKGVLGVAVIQTILVGIGFSLSGIPHAPVWTLLALVLCIVQLGPTLILIGGVAYLYSNGSATTASLWAAYFVLVALSDNILKPILLAKGAEVPMLVIFIGVVGGFMMSGFIGLFTGAIVLSICYKLTLKWLNEVKLPG